VHIEDINQTKLETNESLDTIQSFQNAKREMIKSAE
jgi:hypothetical protein